MELLHILVNTLNKCNIPFQIKQSFIFLAKLMQIQLVFFVCLMLGFSLKELKIIPNLMLKHVFKHAKEKRLHSRALWFFLTALTGMKPNEVHRFNKDKI